MSLRAMICDGRTDISFFINPERGLYCSRRLARLFSQVFIKAELILIMSGASQGVGESVYDTAPFFFSVLEGCNGGMVREDYSAVSDFPPSRLIFLDEHINPKLAKAVGARAFGHQVYSVLDRNSLFGLKKGMDDLELMDVAFVSGGAYILSSDHHLKKYPRMIYVKQSTIKYKDKRLAKDLELVFGSLSQEFPEYKKLDCVISL